MRGENSFLFSGLEGVKRPTPLLTPTKIKIKQKKAYENENKNNKKITDWISGNYDTEVREKLGKSEGRQLVSVGDKGGALTLALEWGGTRTLSIEWEGGEAQSSEKYVEKHWNEKYERKNERKKEPKNEPKNEPIVEPKYDHICEEKSGTKNEKMSGTVIKKPDKRRVWVKLSNGLYGYRTVKLKASASKSERNVPAPKQSRTPSAPASTNKRKLPDNEGGGNRLEDNNDCHRRTGLQEYFE